MNPVGSGIAGTTQPVTISATLVPKDGDFDAAKRLKEIATRQSRGQRGDVVQIQRDDTIAPAKPWISGNWQRWGATEPKSGATVTFQATPYPTNLLKREVTLPQKDGSIAFSEATLAPNGWYGGLSVSLDRSSQA